MKRPQRFLLMILSSAAVSWLVLRLLLHWTVTVGLAAAVLLVLLVLAIWGRHLMLGRYRLRRHQWTKAIESLQRFEKTMLTSRHSGFLLPLYLGIYTIDGVALTRNHIGNAFIQLQKLDEAEGWLRSALLRDPLYPVPYTHLGIIAARRGQEAHAKRCFAKAVELGFNPTLAQQLLARALATSKPA